MFSSVIPFLVAAGPLAIGFAAGPDPGALAIADTTTYVVLNHGRPAGDMTIARSGESVVVRYQHIDRNRGRWLENRYRIDAAGRVLMAEGRPMSRDGDVGDPNDRFELSNGEARWRRGGGGGGGGQGSFTIADAAAAFYRLGNATAFDDALLVRFLLDRPDRSASLLPQGAEVRLEIAAETTVTGAEGPRRLRYAVVHGMGDGPLVIRGGDVFDSERAALLANHTVVVEGERIVAVGPADEIEEPTGARVIEAGGRTVMPGLWDMHVHLQATTQSDGALTMLATGLTTVRDLAADLDVAVSYRDRLDEGRLAGPRVILGGFIEGPGDWAGPSEAVASNEEEARAWVERYHQLGYRQIKLYNLVHPDFVPTIAEETHRRGMRLSGHVPRGLSVPAAVRLGFDEINHAAFLFSTFFQDSLYVPEMRPYSGVASVVAPGFDVDAPEVTELIELFRERGTVIDGTYAIWMGGAGALGGEGNPAAESYRRMLARLYEGGVTIVAGTDNTRGTTFVTELELHEYAGIPSEEVLRIATLGAAEVMGEDADYGSLAPGKVADILVVDGRPTEGVAALRDLDYVIRAGRVFRPDELRDAARGGDR
jgi:imidazolonepropionase-like amidohydrolase